MWLNLRTDVARLRSQRDGNAPRGNQPLILGPETFINQACHTYDVKTGKQFNIRSLRSGCSNSLVAADG